VHLDRVVATLAAVEGLHVIEAVEVGAADRDMSATGVCRRVGKEGGEASDQE